jgi:T5SS/PEP-CTERM-associated repeat protein
MVLVSGQGSTWSNQSTLIVGDSDSISNLLLVAGGSVLASNLVIGGGTIGSNNVLRLDSGSVIVKNALGNGSLVVGGQLGQGALLVNGGSLTVDSLVATNNTSVSIIHTNVVNFNGGVLNSGGTAITNGQTFAVGDGVDAAIYHLLGGVHSFRDGLKVLSNAVLSGCGTISGTVVVDPGGMVLANCGGVLTFTGSVTNNGLVRATNGSTLEGYNPVVNNGVIDIQTGTTNFHSTFINNGTVADASYFRVMSITRQNNDIQLRWATIGGRSYVVQTNMPTVNGSYTNAFTDVGAALLAPGLNVGTTNYLDVGGATNTPSRFYRVRLVP